MPTMNIGETVAYAPYNDIRRPLLRSLKVYREMRKDPTLILARAVSNAPILASDWSVEGDVDDRVKDYLVDAIDVLWQRLINNMLCGKDFGFQSFEVVWELKEGLYFPVKLKQLYQEKTILQVDEYGNLQGCKYDDKFNLTAEKFFNYTYGQEYINYYGTPQPENVREHAYYPYLETRDRMLKYMVKVAGVIPMIKYPIGESQDKAGQTIENFEIAKRILEQLGQGSGVAMPQELLPYAEQMTANGVDPDKWLTWQISFLEPSGSHGSEFLEALRYFDSLKMRGYLIPERAATEGQYGTKAEAESHGDIAVSIALQTFDEMLWQINKQLVNKMLEINFGPEYIDKAKLVRVATNSKVMDMLSGVMQTVLSNPMNTDLLTKWVNVDAVFEALGIPKASDSIADITDDEQTNIALIQDAVNKARNEQSQENTDNSQREE